MDTNNTNAGSPGRVTPGVIFRAMRVNQWTKNGVVLAAFFFAFWDRDRSSPLPLSDLLRVIPAMIAFCIVSSGIYVMNDVLDADADRRHPVKRRRPVAAGEMSVPFAWGLAAVLLAIGFGLSAMLTVRFAVVLLAYALIQVVYSLWLKKVALVDILVIAGGFVLRAISGAVVLNHVTISPWLLLCTFLLALFLALCKRRHEKNLADGNGVTDTRTSLQGYDRHLLDLLIAVASGATIVSYAIYTLWPDTVHKFGTSALGFTIPFVVFGIFRYLDLVYRHDKGDRPEKILLTDVPLVVNVVLYVLALIAIFRITGHAP